MDHYSAADPQGTEPPYPGLARGRRGSPGGESILIVDDTPVNLRLLSQMLAEEGYRVRPVPDGALALAAVAAELPDLILLDIRMPGMDGYQVCEHLKADTASRDVPIIFISALDATADKVRAFTAGGVDYITKPFRAEEVLARVETHLALRAMHKALQEANEKMTRQLCLAGEVQASFLPRHVPQVAGWRLAARLLPASETSGDFYDFIALPGGRWGIVVADVTDKGAGAALYMALTCTLIRTYALEYPGQPELVLGAVNRRILQDCSGQQFVTVFYGVLDPVTGTLVYANAGHCPGLHFGSRGKLAGGLATTGVPLGIFGDKVWRQETARLEAGDALVLYTDGITEAYRERPPLFGQERLEGAVQATLAAAGAKAAAPEEIEAGILAEVQRFVGGASAPDDVALVVVVRGGIVDGEYV